MSSWSVANGKAPGTFWCKLHDARGNLFKAAIILDKTKQSQLYLESNAKPLLIGSPPAWLLIKLQFRSMADSFSDGRLSIGFVGLNQGLDIKLPA